MAYQPAWAEYRRMPTIVSGEMRTRRLNGKGKEEADTVSNAQWHNILNVSSAVMSKQLLRPFALTNQIIARNNILNPNIIGTNTPWGIYFYDDPIMNMSEHDVTTILPIISSDLRQIKKAETKN